MSLITRYFAADYDFEKSRAKWLDSQLTQSIAREQAKDRELKAAYKTIERISLRSADAAMEFAGKKGKFQLVEKKPDEDIIVYTNEELAKYEHYARELRDADIAKGLQVKSLEDYIDAVKASPDNVFI